MRPLPNLGGADADDRPLQLGRAEQLDRRGGLLLVAERVAHVLDASCDADTTARMRPVWPRAFRAVAQPYDSLLRTSLEHRKRAHPLRQRILRRLQAALTVDIASAQL